MYQTFNAYCSQRLKFLLQQLNCCDMRIDYTTDYNPYYGLSYNFHANGYYQQIPFVTIKVSYDQLENLAYHYEEYSNSIIKHNKELKLMDENPTLKEAYLNYQTLLTMYSA